jgi:hypothetical protein
MLTNISTAFATNEPETVLVKINSSEGGDKLIPSPETVNVNKNAIVVWMNAVSMREVKLIFEDGKTCQDVVLNPNMRIAGFFLDSKGCYSTSFMDYASTTSLQFPQSGTFEYKLLSEDGKMSGMGKVVVK